MNEAEKYFLVVADELNISKAASRLFVSHQNVSQHIQALENKYNVKLLNRKPRLSLTQAGEELVHMLTRMRMLEQEFQDRIDEDSENFQGEISFGMPHPRSYILIPEIVPLYRQRYPQVRIRFTEGTSKQLTEKIISGDLDMSIGIKSLCVPQLEYEVLLSEKIYLAIPDKLLRNYHEADYPTCIERFRSGVDILEFHQVPFSINSKDNYIRSLVEDFLVASNVSLNFLFESTSQEVQLLLCQRGALASFCTQMHLQSIEEYNRRALTEERLHVFPILDLKVQHEISLIYHKERYFPPYKQHMRNTIRHVLKNFDLLDHFDFG